MKSSTGRRLAIASGFAVAAVAWACGEPLIQPTDLDAPPTAGPMSAEDSVRILATLPQLPPGLARAPGDGVFSDSMVLEAAGGFIVTLDDRECASPDNRISVHNPTTSTLSSAMCQEDYPQHWAFFGPFDSADAIVLEFEKGSSGTALGEFQVTGVFPSWAVKVEDGFDNDFNDLELLVQAVPAQVPLELVIASDTSVLHPAVRSYSAIFGDTLVQAAQSPGVARLTVTVEYDGAPVSGVEVDARAEFIPKSGGHEHVGERIDLIDSPNNNIPGADACAVLGHFRVFGACQDVVNGITDEDGEVTIFFVAGWVGGTLEVVAETSSQYPVADTLAITVAVPDLSSLTSNATALANGYFVGGTSHHLQGDNWYATAEFADSLARTIAAMRSTINGQDYYLQVNDLSLGNGGAFTTVPPISDEGQRVEQLFRPPGGHVTHALGIDVDIGFCFTTRAGEDGGTQYRIYGEDCATDGVEEVPYEQLKIEAHDRGLIVLEEGDHYHLRLRGAP